MAYAIWWDEFSRACGEGEGVEEGEEGVPEEDADVGEDASDTTCKATAKSTESVDNDVDHRRCKEAEVESSFSEVS